MPCVTDEIISKSHKNATMNGCGAAVAIVQPF